MVTISLTDEEVKVLLHTLYQACGSLTSQMTILSGLRQPSKFKKPLDYYRRELGALTSIENKIYDEEKKQ